MVGYTSSFDGDGWIVKISTDGDSLWSRVYDNHLFDAIAVDDSTFALCGENGGGDGWLVIIDEEGEIQWHRSYGEDSDDYFNAITKTIDGGFALAGRTRSFGDGGRNGLDFYVVKVDSAGEEEWSRSYGGELVEECFDLIQTSDGGYALAGITNSYGAGDDDFYVVKIDDEGEVIWTRTFGEESNDKCFSIVETDDGGLVVGGEHQPREGVISAILLVRVDRDGEDVWSRRWGLYFEECFEVLRTDDGGYALAGTVGIPRGNGVTDMLLLKTEQDSVNDAPKLFNPTYPSDISLHPSYPNPFNAETTLSFSLPHPGSVSVDVYNLTGRRVQSWGVVRFSAGQHRIIWSPQELPSGSYFVNLNAGSEVRSDRVTLLK